MMNQHHDTYHYYCPLQRRILRRSSPALLFMMMVSTIIIFIVSHPLTVIAVDADNDDGVTNTVGGSADNDESSNNDVCDNYTDAASSSACDGSVDKDCKIEEVDDEDDDNDDLYESPDIEWCRRRPTWRNNDHDDDDDDSKNHKNENYVREYCSKLFNYYPNLEILTKGRHPYLSSSYTTRYKFHDDDIFDEMEKQNDTYNNIPNILDRPLIKQLYECMDDDDELQNQLWKFSSKSNSKSSRMVSPSITKIHRRKDDNNDGDNNDNEIGDTKDNGLLPIMIIVENSINEIEAQYVISLSKCLRSHPPLQEYIFEARKFEGTSRDDSGNDVTFLAGFLQILLPGIAYQIHQIAYLVWNETRWGDRDSDGNDDDEIMEFVPINTELLSVEESEKSSESSEQLSKSQQQQQQYDNKNKVYTKKWWPDPRHMGIRTTEHLSYDKWGGLGYHEDSDSDYTVLVAMSNPNDYKGGEFTLFTDDIKNKNKNKNHNNNSNTPKIPNRNNQISFKPNRLSAVVFLSEYEHGVESITTSGRVTFANELWRYDDSPTFLQRPSPIELIYGNPNRFFSFDEDDYKYPYDKDGDSEEDPFGHYDDDDDDDDDNGIYYDDDDDDDDDDAYVYDVCDANK
jgi:hypothetical protein